MQLRYYFIIKINVWGYLQFKTQSNTETADPSQQDVTDSGLLAGELFEIKQGSLNVGDTYMA